MKFRTIAGRKEVSFECPYDATLGGDVWMDIENLEGMYCFLLDLLRRTSSIRFEKTQKLNVKRRRTLMYIRKALRSLGNRRLPLHVVKGVTSKRHNAKLKGYTILG